MVASPRRWEITVARIADCINAIRFEFRQPSLHMQRVTEEEAKKRCFVGLHIRPAAQWDIGTLLAGFRS
jgi:hypothetical protein